jgi:hypothetical protein
MITPEYMEAFDLFSRYLEMDLAGDSTVKTDPAYLAVASYVFKNAPPEVLELITAALYKCFPHLAEKKMIDEHGKALFRVSDIAEALGVTEDKVLQQCAVMGLEDDISVADPQDVHRLN